MTTLDYDNLKRLCIRVESQLAVIDEMDIDPEDDDRAIEYNKIVSGLEGQLKLLNSLMGNDEIVKEITFTISGYSDDNLSFDGDISDEVGAFKPKKFVMSEGTKGNAEYTDEGVWRINLEPSSDTKIVHIKGISEDIDPESDYTDKVTVTGRIEWILFDSGDIVKRKENRK